MYYTKFPTICKQTRTFAFEMDKKSSKKRENLYNLREIFVATTVGAISFPFALGFMQNLVFKPFRISCKLPNTVVSICGGASIILSGIFASGAFVLSCESFKMSKLLSNSDKVAEKRFELEFNRSEEHVLIWGACSLAIFKFFGGKSRQIVPSHLYYPGAFAKMSVPAAGKSYAGSSAKRKLHILGRRYGCHSCGKRRQKEFIADHMPPNKLVKFCEKQNFYPQCKLCSQKQGGALSSMSNTNAIQTHGATLRMYHLWLPVPLGIAVVKNALGKKESDRTK